MQVFCPYPEPMMCAEAIWKDRLKYNKQIIECKQILSAIEGKKAWRNHPVTKMYVKHKEWLEKYLMCFEAYKKYMQGDEKAFMICCVYNHEANKIRPKFLTDEFCDQHKRRLFTKAQNLYPQFADYGTSEENWYAEGNDLIVYQNGKRVSKIIDFF